MEYKLPPLYKYIIFSIILYLFLRNYKYISQDKFIIIAVLITLLIILLDYMFIIDHPNILETENFDDLDDILEDEPKTNQNNYQQVNQDINRQYIEHKKCKHCTNRNITLRPIYDDLLNNEQLEDGDNMQYY